MSVGILAHLLGKLPYRQLAEKVARHDFPYVQLALSKAISDVDFSLGKLSPGLGNEIGGAFADQGVTIAVMGCYASLITLDDEEYRHNVNRFKEHLRNARHFGATIVATEVGSPVNSANESEHWRRLDRALEELVEEAERWGVTIGLEAAQGHAIDSAESLARTIERHPSSSVWVVFDACNLLNRTNFKDRDRVISEAIRLLGPRIVSVHAKDAREQDGGVTAVAAGQGQIDYSAIWRLLEGEKPHGFVTLEGVSEEQAGSAGLFVKEGRERARREVQR
ncbi:sugar phosphate isomerase/epimerase family protein [Cohnella yongneupensis]|uniref:Sugar phosphate isomerase/epimerase family protein n=1 Tax=Cohnella yongneupensis TaxID=425006 RepID=A0ABW0QZI5_9BACL